MSLLLVADIGGTNARFGLVEQMPKTSKPIYLASQQITLRSYAGMPSQRALNERRQGIAASPSQTRQDRQPQRTPANQALGGHKLGVALSVLAHMACGGVGKHAMPLRNGQSVAWGWAGVVERPVATEGHGAYCVTGGGHMQTGHQAQRF